MPTYETEHNGHMIKVIVRTTSVELYIDSDMVDKQKGYFTGGDLTYRDADGNTYRAVVGIGLFKAHCHIYVNDVKVYEKSKIQLNR